MKTFKRSQVLLVIMIDLKINDPQKAKWKTGLTGNSME